MKAVSGELPSGDEGWAYELKWDGMRVLAYVDPDADPVVRLESSNQRDITGTFPELAGLAAVTGGKTALLDGEVVAFEGGRPSFGRLQQRMHLANPAEVRRRMAEVPVLYQAFDLLHFDGNDTMGLPYTDRRRLLAALLEAHDGAEGRTWALTSSHEDGHALYEAAKAQQLEGVVAKRTGGVYEPGKRSPNWRKVKVRTVQEFVVGGWLTGEGNRSNQLGALLVGYYDGDPPTLQYAGRVGTGFKAAELERLGGLLAERAQDACAFDPRPPRDVDRIAHYLRPELVVQVAFGEWTSEGRLRHPSYLGQREDKAAVDVRRES